MFNGIQILDIFRLGLAFALQFWPRFVWLSLICQLKLVFNFNSLNFYSARRKTSTTTLNMQLTINNFTRNLLFLTQTPIMDTTCTRLRISTAITPRWPWLQAIMDICMVVNISCQIINTPHEIQLQPNPHSNIPFNLNSSCYFVLE